MKTNLFIQLLILFGGIFSQIYAQNDEQKAWLIEKSLERNAVKILDPQNIIVPVSSLKSSGPEENVIEIDHGESMEAGGSYSSSGGAYRTPNNSWANSMIRVTGINTQFPVLGQLTGAGVTIFLFDNKRPLVGHEAFEKRIFVLSQDYIDYIGGKYDTICGGIPERNLHPTLSAGIMVSSSSNNARGAAPGAEVIAFDWDFAEYYLAQYAAQGANLACFPYGYAAGWNYFQGTWRWFGEKGQKQSYLFGFYTSISKKWDDITYHAPYLLVVKSAGNDNTEGSNITSGTNYQVWDYVASKGKYGWVNLIFNLGDIWPDGYNGAQTISDIAVSKNVLTVGALKDDGSILEISGRGPTDDFRIKPDIVANGENVFSTTSASSNSYGVSPNGTSFAVASLAGGTALLLEQQAKLYGKTKLLASTLKALLIHTAEDKGLPGPDCIYGWGLANISKASKLLDDNYQNCNQIHEVIFTTNDQPAIFKVKKKSVSDSLKVTICWSDPSGTPPSISLNPADRMLVNDIDLRVTRINDNQEFFPWKLNPINPSGQAITGDNSEDNVEQVIVNDNQGGDFYIKIYPKPDFVSDKQVVSVIISGIEAVSLPPSLNLTNLNINNVRVEEAQNIITCDNVNVEQSGALTLSAGGSILLKTGFKVQSGATFKAFRSAGSCSEFEQVYPSLIFQNNNTWVNIDSDLKSAPVSGNNSDSAFILKGPGLSVNVFPNPGKGEFTVCLPDFLNTKAINVYNIFGKVYFTKTYGFTSEERIDLTQCPDGVYLVKIWVNDQIYTIKLVKQNN